MSEISAQSTTESDKIATFCKVWGFLKYYHPNVATGAIDWDKEFIIKIKKLDSLHSKQDINTFYLQWIQGLGKVNKCWGVDKGNRKPIKLTPDLEWLNDTSKFSRQLVTKFQHIKRNRSRKENYHVKSDLSIGHYSSFETENCYPDSVFPSPQLRLLTLARYWNVVNYFFPYKYLIGQNWDVVLSEMIPEFRDSKDKPSYHLSILKLVAKLNDTHAKFETPYTNKYFGFKWAPFRFKLINNKAVVTSFYNDSLCKVNDIQYGDVFLSVNSKSIEQIIKEKYEYIEASNNPSKLRDFYYAIFNGNTDSVEVTFERNGIISSKIITRYYYSELNFDWLKYYNQRALCKIIDGNIAYVNVGHLSLANVDSILREIQNTSGIIFDLRNGANGTMFKIAEFLNTDPQPFAKPAIPDISYPGRFIYTNTYYCGLKNKNAYKGKVILLFNDSTQSHAEFTLMALETAPNVISIGSQTAGADGNVSCICLPGDFKTCFSGVGIYYPDGRETQRIGIVPDIEVMQTIEGIRQKRDELLEKAIEVIRTTK